MSLLIMFSSYLSEQISGEMKMLSFFLVVVGFFGLFLFWIYLIGYGYNEIDKKFGTTQIIKKFGIVLIITFFVFNIGSFLDLYYLFYTGEQLPDYINIITGLIFLCCFLYIVVKLTDYRLYDKKEDTRIIDHILTMIMICIFPFGLLLMHAHLRKILKDNNLI
ncbi:hypothetical protein ACFLTE_09045 [Bacteroidota bacterium]